jgi:hypothetical protein
MPKSLTVHEIAQLAGLAGRQNTGSAFLRKFKMYKDEVGGWKCTKATAKKRFKQYELA